MSNDPFDDLEDQLRRTVRDNQPWTRGQRVRRGGLALAAAALVGGGAVAAAGVFSADEPSAVLEAIARGSAAVSDSAACNTRSRVRPGKVTVVPGSADPRIKARYEIFRRPASSRDRAVDPRFASETGQAVLRDTVRAARAANGARFEMAISQGPPQAVTTDVAACLRATRIVALRSIPPSDATLRRQVARVIDERLAAYAQASAPDSQQLSLRAYSRSGRGGSIGGAGIRDGRIPEIGGSLQDGRGSRRFMVLYGLVPDGVASVRVLDRAGPSNERVAPISVTVRDNVYDVALPDQMGPQVILEWRSAAGRVLKRIRTA